MIRDGFYNQAYSGEKLVTLVSADPQSYSSTKRHASGSTPPAFSAENGGPGTPPGSNSESDAGASDANSPCIGCSTGTGGGSAAPGRRLWMEIRPL